VRKLSPERERAVAQVMAIIGPSASRHVVEHAVIFERNFVYRAKNYKQWGRYGVMTKQQKAAAKKFAVALHRLDLGA
jgi:hypothetical protein